MQISSCDISIPPFYLITVIHCNYRRWSVISRIISICVWYNDFTALHYALWPRACQLRWQSVAQESEKTPGLNSSPDRRKSDGQRRWNSKEVSHCLPTMQLSLYVPMIRCRGSRPVCMCNDQFIIGNWWRPSGNFSRCADWLINSPSIGHKRRGMSQKSGRRRRTLLPSTSPNLCDKFDSNLTLLPVIIGILV